MPPHGSAAGSAPAAARRAPRSSTLIAYAMPPPPPRQPAAAAAPFFGAAFGGGAAAVAGGGAATTPQSGSSQRYHLGRRRGRRRRRGGRRARRGTARCARVAVGLAVDVQHALVGLLALEDARLEALEPLLLHTAAHVLVLDLDLLRAADVAAAALGARREAALDVDVGRRAVLEDLRVADDDLRHLAQHRRRRRVGVVHKELLAQPRLRRGEADAGGSTGA